MSALWIVVSALTGYLLIAAVTYGALWKAAEVEGKEASAGALVAAFILASLWFLTGPVWLGRLLMGRALRGRALTVRQVPVKREYVSYPAPGFPVAVKQTGNA